MGMIHCTIRGSFWCGFDNLKIYLFTWLKFTILQMHLFSDEQRCWIFNHYFLTNINYVSIIFGNSFASKRHVKIDCYGYGINWLSSLCSERQAKITIRSLECYHSIHCTMCETKSEPITKILGINFVGGHTFYFRILIVNDAKTCNDITW